MSVYYFRGRKLKREHNEVEVVCQYPRLALVVPSILKAGDGWGTSAERQNFMQASWSLPLGIAMQFDGLVTRFVTHVKFGDLKGALGEMIIWHACPIFGGEDLGGIGISEEGEIGRFWNVKCK